LKVVFVDFGFLRHPGWGWVFAKVFLIGLGTTLFLTPLIMVIARRIGFLDHPNERASHRIPTPLGGGIPIAIGFVGSVLIGLHLVGLAEPSLYVLLGGGVILLILGLVDDYTRGISAILKLVALFALTLALWFFDDRFILRIFPWHWLNFAFTLLWIAGVTSAINAIDNMNGLSVGYSAIACLSYFGVAILTMSEPFLFPGIINRFWGLVSVCLLGACLGFLPYNFPRGRIFIGDAGSFFLGFNLAVLGVMGEWSHESTVRAAIPLLILALPLFDLVFTVGIRHLSGVTHTLGEAIRYCARDHLSHRLVAAGLSPTQAVMILYCVATVLALSAVLLSAEASIMASILHLAQAGVVLLILGVLVKLGSSEKRKS
jgi:UDP-GlcNAc:undecaprenyl-phosphate GlcNAc-1-phosphate transferase